MEVSCCGTFSLAFAYLLPERLTNCFADRLKSERRKSRFEIMDAKWNWLIDNVPLRVVLNVAAFSVWLAASVGLLAFASKF
jgi:hypothetical protein